MLSFGICWFVLFLLLEQTVIPLQLVFHHRLYLPQMFIIAGLVFWVARQARAVNWNAPALVAGTVAVTMLGFGAYHRNELWNQPHRIWEAEHNLDPESSRIMINLSREYLKTGRSQKAITLLYRLLDQDPKDLRAYINIANAFTILGQHERAIFYLEQGVREVPDWPIDEAFRYLMLMGNNHNALQHLQEAEKFYRKALEIAESKKQPGVYLQLARLYHSMDKIQQAIEMAQQAVSQRDKFYEAYFYLGSLYAVSGEAEKARSAFRNAIGGEPAINSKAYKHLANLAEWDDDMQQALALYSKALKFDPHNAETMINIGTIHARQGRFDKASAFFRESLEVADIQQTFRAYYNLGQVAVEQGDARGALHNLQRAYHLNSKDAGTLYALGNLYLDIGRKEKGKQLLTELLRLKPDHPRADFVQKRISAAGNQH
jgi:tetratricopeptide (TPR) repeat protein